MMNFLDPFYTSISPSELKISASQGSRFAKKMAGDFNPLHDPNSKRFCVPGDLLFSIAIAKYGLHKKMAFNFLNLVSADTTLSYPPLVDAQANVEVMCDRSKPILGIQLSGSYSDQPNQIEQLITRYVSFSGYNFPHVLVPLMKQHDVMINPQRPLVIYESMEFEFEHLEFDQLTLKPGDTRLEVNGKRGTAWLVFTLENDGKTIGTGSKKLALGGLREYDQQAVDKLCEDYLANKNAVD